VNVANERQENVVCFDHRRTVAALEEVTGPAVLSVKRASVTEKEIVSDVRQRDIRDFDRQVDMIGHPAVCVASVAKALNTFAQIAFEQAAILRSQEDGLAIVASGNEMVEGSVVMQSWWSPHS
jgi:hypothetical protein